MTQAQYMSREQNGNSSFVVPGDYMLYLLLKKKKRKVSSVSLDFCKTRLQDTKIEEI